MNKLRFLSKKIWFLILFLTILIFSISFNIFGFRDLIHKNYPNLKLAKELFDKKSILHNIENDYNAKFLPQTQFVKLNLTKKKLNFTKSNNLNKKQSKIKYDWYESFYIELLDSEVLIVNYLGKIYKFKIKDIQNKNKKNIDLQNVSSNLSVIRVLDTFIYNKYLYVSFIDKKNNCKNLNISVAKIDSEYLNFENFFQSEECGEYISGGRMQFYKHKNEKGILITTSNDPFNRPGNKPQDINSIFGKILFIDFEKNNPIIFSKGHRVAQGLYAEGNLIISTEHGPRGGDEINKISFNKNYGWPISSYGEKYGLAEINKPHYLKNHDSSGFEEPIFAFVPSIGISEIISLPNSFSKHFENNFIVSSLAGKSLHRLKFDKNYNKVIFNEKIFIGSRIRDLKHHNKTNSIFLALEEKGEIGILTK